MVVAGTHCAPFHRLRTPPRKLLCRIQRGPARDLVRRILDVRASARRPTPQERDSRIDIEHNVMVMR